MCSRVIINCLCSDKVDHLEMEKGHGADWYAGWLVIFMHLVLSNSSVLSSSFLVWKLGVVS